LTFTGGITPRGAYNAGTAYTTGQSVSYTDGCSYVAIQNTTGNAPTNTTYWQKLADKGADGTQGAQGETGAQGAQGIQGIQGIQGPAGADGAQGIQGEDGPAGADGANSINMKNGAGAPAGGLGVDGDYYLNNTTGEIYQKSGGSWAVVADLTGPAGSDGLDGADGLGVPAGGTTGQVLAKNSNTDNDTEWIDPPEGGSSILCGMARCSSSTTVNSSSRGDVVGATVTITPTVASYMIINATFDLDSNTAGDIVVGVLDVDSSEESVQAVHEAAINGHREAVSQNWKISLSAAQHTIKLTFYRAAGSGTCRTYTNTGFTYLLIPQ
jgi:hypothetical protein